VAPDICPSLFYITPDKPTRAFDANDIFMPDRFKILQDSLTQVKEIVANTGTGHTLRVRLLCCYRIRAFSRNYCVDRRINNPQKRICSGGNGTDGLKTDFIHFHLKLEDGNAPEYLLAFIEGADLHSRASTLIQELLCSISWLEISAQCVFLNVFTIGQPVFSTSMFHHLDECINSAVNSAEIKSHKNIKYDITHISKSFNTQLSVSLKNNLLSFQAS